MSIAEAIIGDTKVFIDRNSPINQNHFYHEKIKFKWRSDACWLGKVSEMDFGYPDYKKPYPLPIVFMVLVKSQS